MKPFKIALCQIVPGFDKDKNVSHAIKMVKEAITSGAKLVALPEMFYYPFELQSLKNIADKGDSVLLNLKQIAAQENVYICTGSTAVKQGKKIYNRSYLIGPDGNEIYHYDKRQLFDAGFEKLNVCESAIFSSGKKSFFKKTALGTIGTVICYDIRFPEIVSNAAYKEAELLLVPAVFNQITGPAHWEIVMRARAVENQLFLAAISQGKNSQSSYKAYGHSMVISPWGEILAEAGEDEQIIYADLDPQLLVETRKRLPLLKHRKRIYNNFEKKMYF